VNVPNTGAYQSYQTVSATINLAAGAQTLKVQSSASPIWNFNWIEMVSPGSSTSTLALKSSTTESITEASVAALQVFPNPVTDRFALQINNDLTGAVTVQVLSLSGALQKQFSLTKAASGTSQFYLSIGELPAANYIIKASMNSWTQSTQIIKQ
ncbi:MAG TPA: T9SS type A sorting domain-containing protein, partial [Chitinophagaceae bacterium]|nr:T9SS type A sorting domain-containing protein [Chitinophagaceae bacterium]